MTHSALEHVLHAHEIHKCTATLHIIPLQNVFVAMFINYLRVSICFIRVTVHT